MVLRVLLAGRCSRSSPGPDLSKTSARYVKYVLIQASIANEVSAFPDEVGRIIARGLEAKNASPMAGTSKCEWFKLFLEPHALRDESAVDPRLPDILVSQSPVVFFNLGTHVY